MELDFLGIGLRWLHIMSAIALFGGLIFREVAVIPASQELGEEDRQKLNEGIRRRWAKIVALAALILIVTGVWNIVLFAGDYSSLREANIRQDLKEQLLVPSWYKKIVLPTKICLALVVFFLSSLLVGRGKLARKVQANSRKWVCLAIVLAMIIVAMSAVLRSVHTGPNAEVVVEVFVDDDPPPLHDENADNTSNSTGEPEQAPEELQIDLPDF